MSFRINADREQYVVVAELLNPNSAGEYYETFGIFLADELVKFLSSWANNPNDTRLLRVFPVGAQVGYYNKSYNIRNMD